MARRSLAAAVRRVLKGLDIPATSRPDGAIEFFWPYTEDPSPVTVLIVENRLICCYVPVPIAVPEELIDATVQWVGVANTGIFVGNFEFDGETVIYKNSIDALLIDPATLETLLPELCGLAARMASDHESELLAALEQAALEYAQVEGREEFADDLATSVTSVVADRFGSAVSDAMGGAIREVVDTYIDDIAPLLTKDDFEEADDDDLDDSDESDAAQEPDDDGGKVDGSAELDNDDNDVEEEFEYELPSVQFDVSGDETSALLVLSADGFPPMHYPFSPATLSAVALGDESGITLYHHADAETVERVLTDGFEDERHEIVPSDTRVDGVSDADPETIMTRRVLLTSAPRPLDDRGRNDRMVRLHWSGDAGALGIFEWGETAFSWNEEEERWDATPMPQLSRKFLVPAAVLNYAIREAVARLEIVGR